MWRAPNIQTSQDFTLLVAVLKISILVPAYNEKTSIRTVIDRVFSLGIENLEVIVVDDGSTDGTREIVEQSLSHYPHLRLLVQPTNRGKTDAIARAIKEANGDILMIQDADLEYDPQEIPDVIQPILDNQADVVYGSRFMVKKAARVLYFYHYLANKGLTFLSNFLTNRNMSDIETCYKAFRKEVLQPMTLTSRGFGLEVEITAMICKTQARTYEVPISYYGRTYDEGKKIGMRDGFEALWFIFYYNLVHPYGSAGKRYIAEVNHLLAERRTAGE